MATKKSASKKSAAKPRGAKSGAAKKGASKKGASKKGGAKRGAGKAAPKNFPGGLNWGGDIWSVVNQLLRRGTQCQRRCVRTFINQINAKGANIDAANTQLRKCIRKCESTSLSDLLDGHL